MNSRHFCVNFDSPTREYVPHKQNPHKNEDIFYLCWQILINDMSMLKNYRFSHLTENTIFVTPEWSCRTSGKNCYARFCLSLLLFVMRCEVFLPSFLGIRSKFRTDDVQNFTLNLASSILLLYEKVDFFEYLIQSFKSTIYYKLSTVPSITIQN